MNTASPAPAPVLPDTIDPQTAHAIYKSIHHTHQALCEIRDLLQAQTIELGVGGTATETDLENWPVPGLTRKVLTDRRANGTDSFPAPAGFAVLVVEALPGRLGGTIVNSGANPAILYLCQPGRVAAVSAGNPAIFLAANGGSWDFRLGAMPWGGAVSVISAAGTTLTIAQA